MLFSEGNVEIKLAHPAWRALLDAARLPGFVTGRLTNSVLAGPRRPPRLLVRSLAVILPTVLAILAAVFAVLAVELRARVRAEVADGLETDRMVVSTLDAQRQVDASVRLEALASNPTLESALVKFANTYGGFTPLDIRQSMEWLERELLALGDGLGADVVAMLDPGGRTMARAGGLAADWPARPPLALGSDGQPASAAVLRAGPRVLAVVTHPVRIGRERVGTLCLARRLDDEGARAVSNLTRAHTVFLVDGVVTGSTLTDVAARSLATAWRGEVSPRGEATVAGVPHAFRCLSTTSGARVFALAPLSESPSRGTAKTVRALLTVALGALVLAVVGSVWLARRLADPINTISDALSVAVARGDRGVLLESTGTSREIDDLVRTFNVLMTGLSKAEAESRAASLGAIQSLAKALEARDPYTAGHSERVGELSVRIGIEMGLAGEQLEALRIGASLHDIGKIGIPDTVLQKPAPLTGGERIGIRTHPTMGARILEPVAFLAAHLPIVAMHHERPDGLGYPAGLVGSCIPLPARIVHLADAFDAMTSDRPYRPGRPPREARDEIVRGRGTEFDGEVVDAFLRVVDRATAEMLPPSGAHVALTHPS
jgi:HD-GYP domain-containing protein (c-di-GMP phosphodiesterase class II)